MKVLEQKGYELMEEVEFPPYRVDIYLPEYHVAIEVDGPQHSEKEMKKRDERLYEDYNLIIYHVPVGIPNSLWLPKITKWLDQDIDTANLRWDEIKLKLPWL